MESTQDSPTLLLVDDTPTNLDVLVNYLGEQGFDILVATSGEQAIQRCQNVVPDLILLDVMMPGIDGFETCRRLKSDPATEGTPVIFMTALTNANDKVKGFEAGGVDYVTKPIQHQEVLARIDTHLTISTLQTRLEDANERLEERVAERTADLEEAIEEIRELKKQLEEENSRLREELDLHEPYGDIVGQSPAIALVIDKIEMVATTDATALVLGESGTGKELIAREIHRRSKRRKQKVVKVNCASIPRDLFESEFFGHVKGAFTGAVSSRMGRFAAANGGTLFLDEVGEIPPNLQGKLLRVLQDGQYQRVGEARTRTVDVRLVAATNRDLEVEVREGRFREDLFYRLNVFPIVSPPLRNRREDIPLLTTYFLEKAARRFGIAEIPSIRDAQLQRLTEYDWPGNVRELQNIVERAVIAARATGVLNFEITGEDTSPLTSAPRLEASDIGSNDLILTEGEIKKLMRENTINALKAADWRIRGDGGAAELLDLKPTTLASRIKRMDIDKPK